METTRLEAFSDGVIAVIITVLVLEMKVPHGPDLAALAPVLPVFLSYVLSFVYVGIYWNNHHHMFQLAESVDGAVLWTNLHLLFWLSLLPFTTGWMGENHFERWPTVLYGANLLDALYRLRDLQLDHSTRRQASRRQGLSSDRQGQDSRRLIIPRPAKAMRLVVPAGVATRR